MADPHIKLTIDSSAWQKAAAELGAAHEKTTIALHRYARRAFWRGMIIGASIAGTLALTLHTFAADQPMTLDEWKGRLEAQNKAELILLTDLESDLARTRVAKANAQSETVKIQAAADLIKAERDRNAGIAAKSIAAEKKSAEFEAEMYAWDGGGAIWWGVKRWFFHAMLVLAGLTALLTLFSVLFPPVGALLGVVGRNLLSLAVRRITP